MNHSAPHYINADEYFQSAVLVTFIFKNNEYHLVLEQRSAHISQAGEVCFPGGRFDEHMDRSTKDTAIRETQEELGVKKDQITNVTYWGTYIAPMYTLIDVYLGFLEVDDVDQLPINKHEVEKLIVIPFSYFLNHPPQLYEIDSWSSPYRRAPNEDHEDLPIFPAKKYGLPSKYHKPWQGKSRKVHLYPTQEAPVWGVTANIIKHFIEENKTIDTLFRKVK